MWKISHSITITTPPETIWKFWSQVDKWPTWDTDITWSKLNGPFIKGTKGQLKPKSGPKTHFIITDTVHNTLFVTQSKLPFTRLIFSHQIVPHDKGITVTHSVIMTGLLTTLFSKLIGKSLAKGIPTALTQLKELAETQTI